MKLFDVYSLYDIEPVRGEGCYVFDKNGERYLDLYGGHAVISIGHAHPRYVKAITDQVGRLGFYSNSVLNGLQQELAGRLGKASGYDDYSLFLCNSGAEANENAIKLASFHTGKKRFSPSVRHFTAALPAQSPRPTIRRSFHRSIARIMSNSPGSTTSRMWNTTSHPAISVP